MAIISAWGAQLVFLQRLSLSIMLGWPTNRLPAAPEGRLVSEPDSQSAPMLASQVKGFSWLSKLCCVTVNIIDRASLVNVKALSRFILSPLANRAELIRRNILNKFALWIAHKLLIPSFEAGQQPVLGLPQAWVLLVLFLSPSNQRPSVFKKYQKHWWKIWCKRISFELWFKYTQINIFIILDVHSSQPSTLSLPIRTSNSQPPAPPKRFFPSSTWPAPGQEREN